MGDDAPTPSLNVHSGPLREVVAALVREEVERERLERQQRIGEIMAAAGQPEPPLTRPKRDRHGMHIVRGLAVAAAGMAALVRHHRVASRVLATAMLATAATASTVTPDMLEHAPAAPVPVRHHERAHHRRRDQDPSAMPVVLPPKRRRRRPQNAALAPPRPRRSAVPSPTASPPDPDPTPSVTPDPHPSPSPTCAHGNSCHGQFVAAESPRAGPSGVINHSAPRRTSAVLNPGPRLDARRTVTVNSAATSARRTDSGSALNSSSVIPAWVPTMRAAASAAVSSRNCASRASTESRRPSRRCSLPFVWSVTAASIACRSSARARSSAASPGVDGTRPGGFRLSFSLATTRVVTYTSRCSSLRNTFRHPGVRHPYRAAMCCPVLLV